MCRPLDTQTLMEAIGSAAPSSLQGTVPGAFTSAGRSAGGLHLCRVQCQGPNYFEAQGQVQDTCWILIWLKIIWGKFIVSGCPSHSWVLKNSLVCVKETVLWHSVLSHALRWHSVPSIRLGCRGCPGDILELGSPGLPQGAYAGRHPTLSHSALLFRFANRACSTRTPIGIP